MHHIHQIQEKVYYKAENLNNEKVSPVFRLMACRGWDNVLKRTFSLSLLGRVAQNCYECCNEISLLASSSTPRRFKFLLSFIFHLSVRTTPVILSFSPHWASSFLFRAQDLSISLCLAKKENSTSYIVIPYCISLGTVSREAPKQRSRRIEAHPSSGRTPELSCLNQSSPCKITSSLAFPSESFARNPLWWA